MSTHKWDIAPHLRSAPCDKRFAVSMEHETLADLVRRVRNEKRLSLREVSLRSGGEIANSHISRIENGESTNLTTEKLQALAKGLGIPEEEIFGVARGRSASGDLKPEEWRLLNYYRGIPYERQIDLLSYSEMLYIRYGDRNDSMKNGEPAAGKVYDAVAGIPKAVKDKQRRAGKSSQEK
jgi:transcriptional regulator with XRE-family HTH domain